MSSFSAYSLEIPSVRQWKAKISFPYAAPPGLVARKQEACAFLITLIGNIKFSMDMDESSTPSKC
ncbi:hypothetical protein [Alteribacillus sp. YIM 98480]|uniref:hypothetical protein n=1 Tax=Alteribacillus sp. YIM 98480 TaxID=2606599 RepID=UPI00131C281E|nr:hypothetical protein [Alteribacillus sp. YIM 98480]